MTFFARALWCGARGDMASVAAARSRPRSEWNARPPMPTPHCWRKQRRDSSFGSGLFIIIGSLFRDCFVQVQHHAPKRRPGAALGRRAILLAGKLLEPLRRRPQLLLLMLEEAPEHGLLRRRREPPHAAPEGV